MFPSAGASYAKGAMPAGPSGLKLAGEKVSEPLTKQENEDLVAAYAKGAAVPNGSVLMLSKSTERTGI